MTQETETVSLLPCPLPWCAGGAQVLGFGVRFYAVCCKSCGLEGPKENDREEAIAAWNTRVSTNKDETIAKLEAENAKLRLVVRAQFASRRMVDSEAWKYAESIARPIALTSTKKEG